MGFFQGIGSLLHQLDEAVFPSSLYCLCCGAMIDESRSYSLCDDCIRKFHWITGTTCEACGKALPERVSSFDAGIDAEGEIQLERVVGDDVLRERAGGYVADVHPDDVASLDRGRSAENRLCYDCMRESPLFAKGFSCVTYGLHERELMMDLKYAGRGYIARKCGDMLFDRIELEIESGVFSPERSPIDMIVPVPIGSDRGAERGYNQSAIMAAQLARRWRQFVKGQDDEDPGLLRCDCSSSVFGASFGASDSARQHSIVGRYAPVLYEDLLYRTRKTRKLRSLSPAERALELEGAFKVRSRYAERIGNCEQSSLSRSNNTNKRSNVGRCTNERSSVGQCTRGARILLVEINRRIVIQSQTCAFQGVGGQYASNPP